MAEPALPVFAADRRLLLHPEERSNLPPKRSGAEVSWLGVIAGGAFPAPSERTSGNGRGLAAYSCGGSAGIAPDFPVASRGDASTPAGLSPARPDTRAPGRRHARSPARRSAWRAVHRDDAPAMPHARPVDMVDAGDRAVFHRKGEAGFRLEFKREAERRADRAAMRDGDDVAPAMRVEHPVDGARNALHHIDKALAARGAFMRRRMPEPVKGAATRLAQFFVGQPLPIPKALLRKVGDRLSIRPGDRIGPRQPGAHDRPRRLVRPAQMARDPHRIARQLARQPGKNRGIGAVARHVLLAVDTPLMRNRRMPYPPEAGRRPGRVGGACADRTGPERGDLALATVARAPAHFAAAASRMTTSPTGWNA